MIVFFFSYRLPVLVHRPFSSVVFIGVSLTLFAGSDCQTLKDCLSISPSTYQIFFFRSIPIIKFEDCA